eukprot:11887877-Prorocentrum_lima.AAC.1
MISTTQALVRDFCIRILMSCPSPLRQPHAKQRTTLKHARQHMHTHALARKRTQVILSAH